MIFVSPSKAKKQWTLPDASGNGVKYVTEESVVNNINEANILIPLELELSESITIDDSWGDLGIFKKYKKIVYTADCSYMVNLSSISSSDLIMNNNTREVEIKIPKPEIYQVNINHDKTVYEEAITGLLRFGDLTLSSEEYGVVEREIKKSISGKMNDNDLYDKACTSTNLAMENLLKNILGDNIKLTLAFM